MARPPAEVLTARESEIMAVLWKLGGATSEELRELLSGDPHDSSVRTLMRVLIGKRYVRKRPNSRPTVYVPAVSQSKVQQKAASSFIKRFFSGSAEALVVRLLADEQLTPEQLSEIKRSHLRSQRKKGKP